MTQIKELYTKAKAWVEKTYSAKSPMNKFDWILIGIGAGAVLASIKSIILTWGVIAILAHYAYKRG